MVNIQNVPSLDLEAGMFGAATHRDVVGPVCAGVGIVIGVVAGLIAH